MLNLVTPTRGGAAFSVGWRRGSVRDEPSPAFVSHTVFGYDRWRDLPAIGIAAERAARLWSGRPGTLWLRQWVHPTRRLMGDLSVWRSEDDLHAFLALPDHVALMTQWRGRMHGQHHEWEVETIDRPAIWDRAVALVAEPGSRS